eukprot:403352764
MKYQKMLNEEEINRVLKKELVKQLQDLKRKDVDRAAFFYVSKEGSASGSFGGNANGMGGRKARNNTKNRKSLANKRRFFELIAHKKQMQAFESGEYQPSEYNAGDGSNFGQNFEGPIYKSNQEASKSNRGGRSNIGGFSQKQSNKYDSLDPEQLKVKIDDIHRTSYSKTGNPNSSRQNKPGTQNTFFKTGQNFSSKFARNMSTGLLPSGNTHEKVDELNELEMTMRQYVPDSKLIHKVLYRRQDPTIQVQNVDPSQMDLQTLLKIGIQGTQAQSYKEKHRQIDQFIQKIDQKRSQKTGSVTKPIFLKKKEKEEERNQKREEARKIEMLKMLVNKKIKIEKQVQELKIGNQDSSMSSKKQKQEVKQISQEEREDIENELCRIRKQIHDIATSPRATLNQQQPRNQASPLRQIANRTVTGSQGFMSQRAVRQASQESNEYFAQSVVQPQKLQNKMQSQKSMPQLEIFGLKNQKPSILSNREKFSFQSNFQLQPLDQFEADNQYEKVQQSPRLQQMLQRIDTIMSKDSSPKMSPKKGDSLLKNHFLLSPYQQVDLWNYFEKEEAKRKTNFHDMLSNSQPNQMGNEMDHYLEAQKQNMLSDVQQVKSYRENQDILSQIQALEDPSSPTMRSLRFMSHGQRAKVQKEFMKRNTDLQIVFNKNDGPSIHNNQSPNKSIQKKHKNGSITDRSHKEWAAELVMKCRNYHNDDIY